MDNGSSNYIANTPLMQQYFEIKKEYSDCILFYRLGDFYEMFYDDAKIIDVDISAAN